MEAPGLAHYKFFSYKKQIIWLQPECFLVFSQIQPELILKCSLYLKTFNDMKKPDQATVMQEKGCSGASLSCIYSVCTVFPCII